MIDKKLVDNVVNEAIEGTSLFVVDTRIEPGNRIVVEIDSPEGVDIDTCADITRRIEAVLDRDVEDYELEVGSAGLTAPFKVKGQYLKNLGNEVEVLTTDGRKLRGVLTAVDEDTFTVTVKAKERVEGKKRPVEVEKPVILSYDSAKKVNYIIKF